MSFHQSIQRLLVAFLALHLTVSSLYSFSVEEIVEEDSFFDSRKVQLTNFATPRKTLEFTRRGLDFKPESLNRKEMEEFAQSHLGKQFPRGLLESLLEQNYKIQMHFGTLQESIYLLKKEGYQLVRHVFPAIRGGVHLLVAYAQGEELQDAYRPPRLVITELRSKALLEKMEWSLAVQYGSKVDSLIVYDFHPVLSDSYRSGAFKEALFHLPRGNRSVVLGSSKLLLQRLMERKFAAMSLKFLQGLYGSDFSKGMKNTLIEEGFLKAMDWDVTPFGRLHGNKEKVLSGFLLPLFDKFETELLLLLAQKPKHSLSELLVVGNEIAISKEPLLKEEIESSLGLSRSFELDVPLKLNSVPVLKAGRVERVLFIDGVVGDQVGIMVELLHHLGIKKIGYFGAAYGGQSKSELILPLQVEYKGKNFESGIKNPVLHALKTMQVQKISHYTVPQAYAGSKIVDNSSVYYLKGMHELGLEAHALLLGQGTGFSRSVEEVLKEQERMEALVDPLLAWLDIEDLLIEEPVVESGYFSLEEKMKQYRFKHGLEKDVSILFHVYLDAYLKENLRTPEEKKSFLSKDDMVVSSSKRHLAFSYFLDRPYRDQDVIAHLSQIDKTMQELDVYLKLLGVKKATLHIGGGFQAGLLTPLSPLEYALEGLGQRELYELKASPFGDPNHPRRFLVRLIPREELLDQSHPVIEFPLKEEEPVTRLYLNALESLGVVQNKEGLFEWQMKKYEKQSQVLRLKMAVNRFLVGSEALLRLARTDFLREKSRVFALSPWSQKKVDELHQSLRTSVGDLTREGLELKQEVRNSKASEKNKLYWQNLIDEKVSSLESFISAYESY